jgi:hypothetical protein
MVILLEPIQIPYVVRVMVLAKFNPMCTTKEHFNNHMIKRRDDPLQYIFFSSEILTPPFICITILIFFLKSEWLDEALDLMMWKLHGRESSLD